MKAKKTAEPKRCRKCHFLPCRCRELADQSAPMAYGKGWPMKSVGMGVHPEQVAEIMERNKKHGITGVTYDKQGDAIISTPKAKAALMRLEGHFDKNGGYGDTYEGTSSLPQTREEGADQFTDAGPQKNIQVRNSAHSE